MRVEQVVVSAIAFLFGGVGIGFWTAPERVARVFHLEATGVAGVSSLRADLGGAFVGLALLCLVGAWARQRALLMAAMLVLACAMSGRLIGVIVDGLAGLDRLALGIEVVAIVALTLCASRVPARAARG